MSSPKAAPEPDVVAPLLPSMAAERARLAGYRFADTLVDWLAPVMRAAAYTIVDIAIDRLIEAVQPIAPFAPLETPPRKDSPGFDAN